MFQRYLDMGYRAAMKLAGEEDAGLSHGELAAGALSAGALAYGAIPEQFRLSSPEALAAAKKMMDLSKGSARRLPPEEFARGYAEAGHGMLANPVVALPGTRGRFGVNGGHLMNPVERAIVHVMRSPGETPGLQDFHHREFTKGVPQALQQMAQESNVPAFTPETAEAVRNKFLAAPREHRVYADKYLAIGKFDENLRKYAPHIGAAGALGLTALGAHHLWKRHKKDNEKIAVSDAWVLKKTGLRPQSTLEMLMGRMSPNVDAVAAKLRERLQLRKDAERAALIAYDLNPADSQALRQVQAARNRSWRAGQLARRAGNAFEDAQIHTADSIENNPLLRTIAENPRKVLGLSVLGTMGAAGAYAAYKHFGAKKEQPAAAP